MRASSQPSTRIDSDLPAVLQAAQALLDQASQAMGWLDSQLRLRWANAALLDRMARHRLPAAGLCFEDYSSDAERLRLAAARASNDGSGVRVPGLRMANGQMASAQVTMLDGIDGFLLEIGFTDAPVEVPVAASLRSLAHELKNPLGGLRGAAQLLSRRVLDADLRAYAGIIVAEVDRLSALTNRLLAPMAGRPFGAINVHGALERVRMLLLADETVAQRDYDPSLPECGGDLDRLVQAFLNIARNAVEAGATGIVLRTRYESDAMLAQARGAAVRVEIEDDGAGVPDALRSSLFLPLVSGREGGTGLGLAMAGEIIREHGGRIGYESRPGRTVFKVWLPLVQEMPG